MSNRRYRHRSFVAATAFAVTLAAATSATAQSSRRPGSAAPTATSPAPAQAGVVDVNSATEEQLQLLPGIGPTKARAILALRQRMGRFRHVEDLLRVRGIGRATLRRIRALVSLQGGTTMTARARSVRSPWSAPPPTTPSSAESPPSPQR